MAAKLDCPGALDGGRTGIGPSHGKRDDDQEGIQLSWLREAGVFHVEAAGLAVTEEALNLPASSIGLEGSFAIAVADDDQELTAAEPFGGEAERKAQAAVHGLEAGGLAVQEPETEGSAQEALEL